MELLLAVRFDPAGVFPDDGVFVEADLPVNGAVLKDLGVDPAGHELGRVVLQGEADLVKIELARPCEFDE